ncbi:MAG: phosphotransferase [Nanoarchaeota archaeon]|nr:phosphotransferase [Nanoarchaeota archaeon]
MEVLKHLLELNYGLSDIKLEKNEVGYNNESYNISSNKGKFFLKQYFRLPMDILEEMLDLISYLKESGLPVAKPLKTKDKTYFTLYKDMPCVLFTHLEGKIKFDFTKEELYDAGLQLAKFHKIIKNYRVTFVTVDKDYNSTEWYDKNIRLLKTQKTDEAYEIVREFYPLDKKYNLNDLPMCLLHWDYRDQNVLFKSGKVSGIIDFERLMFDNRIYDLIFGAIGFCCQDGILDMEKLQAFYNGYSEQIALTKEEKEIFGPLLKLMIWDKWCSIYITSFNPSRNQRKSRKKYNLYKKVYYFLKELDLNLPSAA